MSAITGIFYRDGQKVDPELIKKMNNRLSHRGPDGSAVWCEGSVALGHQMLWTTPESLHEKLPFEDEESGLVITADARIDNRDELSKELNIEDKEEVSDSYFILKAYEKWGKNCPDKLLGDFSFAIWDKNEENLFCARDHMGVKPFYYYLNDEMFVFGTEIKALNCLDSIPEELNEIRVADYLVSLTEDREITFYEHIYRLPAAYLFNIDSNKIKKICYWKLDPVKETIMDSDEEYAQKFLQIFTEAVKCRMRSAFPVGSFLSGGLDSSSIVCTARKILNEQNSDYNLKTFSLVFDDLPDCDERDYINEVLALGRLESYFIRGDILSPLFEIDMALEKVGQPFNDGNSYFSWQLCQEAQEKGVRILLDGFDGDTTVFFEEKYALDLARDMQLRKLLREIKFMARKSNLNSLQMFLYVIVLPLIPESLQKLIQKILNLFNINWNIIDTGIFNIVNDEFMRNTGLKNRYQYFYKDPMKIAKTNKLCHHWHLSLGFLQYMLETFDIIAANFSIEHGYPFFDRRLVEFCLSLPKEQKFSQMWDRFVMRNAMNTILPPKIQWRVSKTGLGINFRRNMLLFDKSILENSILKQSNIISEYVNLEYIENLYEKYESGFKKVKPLDLWLVTVLILWLKNKSFKVNSSN